MLRGQPVLAALIINLILGTVWHYTSFLICVFRKTSSFSPDKKIYRPHKWERGGKFYSDVFKINKWKDILPQHIGRHGFSKEHLTDLSPEYVDEFIMETCRGEWNHRMNCLFGVVLFLINSFFTAFILTLLLLLGNLPFIFIQRYNRMRLQKLKATLLKKARLEARRQQLRSSELQTENNVHQAQ